MRRLAVVAGILALWGIVCGAIGIWDYHDAQERRLEALERSGKASEAEWRAAIQAMSERTSRNLKEMQELRQGFQRADGEMLRKLESHTHQYLRGFESSTR